MAQRKSSSNPRLLLASFFSILPAIFPPAKIIDYDSGEPKRRRNAAITFPEMIEVPEGLISKQYLSPSPSPSRTQSRNRKPSLAKKPTSSPSTPLTIEVPGSAPKKLKRPSSSRRSSGLSSPPSPSGNSQKRRRLSNASALSPLPSPRSPNVTTRSGRTVGKKAWND